MKCTLFAVGRAGARAARSLVEGVMTGLVKADSLSLVLIGIRQEDRESLERLLTPLKRLYREENGAPFFSTPVTALILPEEEMDESLMEKCQTPEDKLLMAALFSGDRTLRRSAGSSMETAQTAWADLLNGDNEVVKAIQKLSEEDGPVLLAASLTEPLGAAGCGLMQKEIRKYFHGPLCGVFGLKIRKKDRTDLAASALREISQMDGLYIFGLPDDAATDGDGIEELVGLRCMADFLEGGRGCFSYAVPLDTPDWSMFGDRAEKWEAALTDFLYASLFMLVRYGPEADERLRVGGNLSMRGWFGRVYGKARSDTGYTAREKEILHALLSVCRYFTAWCYVTTGNLPLSLRCQAQLLETMDSAGVLYDRILEEAGQLSLLNYDLKRAGLLDDETVSRSREEVTEAENARKKITRQAEKVKNMAEELRAMEQIMGGRNTLILLEDRAANTLKEAENLEQQGREAERRIGEAAMTAGPEDMPRIDAARSRLRGLERHLMYLRGKAAYARRDLEEARKEENRSRPPRASLAAEDPDVLYERRYLRQVLKAVDTGSDVRRSGPALLESMQRFDAREILDRLERNAETAEGTMGLFETLYALISMEREGR